ncbi:hypothetical protein [Geobacter anodireducens]
MLGKGLWLAVCAVILLGTPATAGTIAFVAPTPNTWVGRSDHLVLKLNNPEITAVRINVNGVVGDMLAISSPEYRKAFQDFLIVQPLWDQGRNEVSVEAYAGKERVETTVATVYYAPGRMVRRCRPSSSRLPSMWPIRRAGVPVATTWRRARPSF